MVGHSVLEIVHVSSATCCHGPYVKARLVTCVCPFCSHSSIQSPQLAVRPPAAANLNHCLS